MYHYKDNIKSTDTDTGLYLYPQLGRIMIRERYSVSKSDTHTFIESCKDEIFRFKPSSGNQFEMPFEDKLVRHGISFLSVSKSTSDTP